jgi:hypothetical protein
VVLAAKIDSSLARSVLRPMLKIINPLKNKLKKDGRSSLS